MANVNVVRKKSARIQPALKFRFDYWLLLIVTGLLVLGLLMVYSTTFDLGLRQEVGDAAYFFKRQVIALILGSFGIFIITQFDYHAFRNTSIFFMVFTLIILSYVLFFGEPSLGARRGLYEGSFQPSEIAKLATILYISHWLSSKGDRIKDLTYGLFPFSVITGVVCALIAMEPDLSTAILIALISLTLFFIAGADWRQFVVAGLFGTAAFAVLINIFPHASQRLQEFWKGVMDPSLAGWQTQQSLVGLSRGGIFGVGLGESTQKFGPLPFAHNDAVFAILAEELGLFGSLLLIGMLAALVWRGFRTARLARDSYGAMLALGVTSWIAYQALINIAVIANVIPFTGIPLPFISYGGSSLFSTLLGVGVLLSVSRDASLKTRSQRPAARSTRRNPRSAAYKSG
ncbi:MAG: FtsW/RodA/SpoVE family cell cycle protein [Anaerolineae bacterium]